MEPIAAVPDFVDQSVPVGMVSGISTYAEAARLHALHAFRWVGPTSMSSAR
jgi:hypothetical protein